MTDSLVNEMLDRHAIVDIANSYCWAIDRNEYELLRDVFLPNATAVLGGEHCDGIDAIIARIDRALTPLDDSQHLITNHQIRITGDTATSRCYLHAQHIRRAADGGPNFIVAGRYEDDLVRTSVGWRISHRTLTTMWTDGNVRVVRPAPISPSA